MTGWGDHQTPAGAGHDADSTTPAGYSGVTQAGWNARLRRRRDRRSCQVPDCGTTGRPYPAGFLCDQHRPGSPGGGSAA